MTMNQLLDNVQGSDFNHAPAGRVDFFPPVPDHVDQVSLSTSNVAYTVPASARFIIFFPQPGVEYAVRKNAVAVYPAAGITDGTGSILNPGQLDVKGVTTLGFISNSTGFLTMAIYG